MRDDALSLTWCVRDAGEDERSSTRVIDDLSTLCRDTASRHFPEDEGFTLAHRRLSGALEGTTTSVSRGSFRALVSVQRFTRHAGEHTSEIRLVASAHRDSPGAIALRSDRKLARAGMVACSAGGAALLVGTLQLAHVLSTWGLLMVLMPLFMAWRMAMTMRLAAELQRDARPPALPPAAQSHVLTADELPRWRALLEVVAAQRDAVSERFQGQGFRIPGAQPGTVASFAPPIDVPAPVSRPLPVPDLALPPLGRTTAL